MNPFQSAMSNESEIELDCVAFRADIFAPQSFKPAKNLPAILPSTTLLHPALQDVVLSIILAGYLQACFQASVVFEQ